MLVLGKCAAQRAELAERAYLVLATSQKAAFAPYKAQLLKLLKMKRKDVVRNIFSKAFPPVPGCMWMVHVKDLVPVAVKKIKNFDKAALEELETLRSLNLATPIYMAPEVCV